MYSFLPSEIPLDEKELTYITLAYLEGWTNIPLTSYGDCDIDKVKFYDGFFGYILRRAEHLAEYRPELLENNSSWKYQGKLYRVIHPCMRITQEGEETVFLPDVQYHQMIAHWTSDYTFSGLLYKLSPEEEYIILEADTGKHFGFDVNKFYTSNGADNRYTKVEQEIIFPMYEECTKEYRMSISDFINLKNTQNTDCGDE